MRKSLITAGLAGLAVVGVLAGCGGSSAKVGQTAPNPPGVGQPAATGTATSAAEVLAGDGYTVDPATLITASQVVLNLGIADRASGTHGARAEQVLIFTRHPSAPICKETPAVCTPEGMAGEITDQDPGTVARADGNVLRITGPVATFTKDGLPV